MVIRDSLLWSCATPGFVSLTGYALARRGTRDEALSNVMGWTNNNVLFYIVAANGEVKYGFSVDYQNADCPFFAQKIGCCPYSLTVMPEKSSCSHG